LTKYLFILGYLVIEADAACFHQFLRILHKIRIVPKLIHQTFQIHGFKLSCKLILLKLTDQCIVIDSPKSFVQKLSRLVLKADRLPDNQFFRILAVFRGQQFVELLAPDSGKLIFAQFFR